MPVIRKGSTIYYPPRRRQDPSWWRRTERTRTITIDAIVYVCAIFGLVYIGSWVFV